LENNTIKRERKRYDLPDNLHFGEQYHTRKHLSHESLKEEEELVKQVSHTKCFMESNTAVAWAASLRITFPASMGLLLITYLHFLKLVCDVGCDVGRGCDVGCGCDVGVMWGVGVMWV
jgi:hypothetical protein